MLSDRIRAEKHNCQLGTGSYGKIVGEMTPYLIILYRSVFKINSLMFSKV